MLHAQRGDSGRAGRRIPQAGPSGQEEGQAAQETIARARGIDGGHDRGGRRPLYTSAAAAERSSVELGGRRLIQKKKTKKQRRTRTTEKKQGR